MGARGWQTRLGKTETLDALLRMELRFRALSRVKVGYAYRLEELTAQALSASGRASLPPPAPRRRPASTDRD